MPRTNYLKQKLLEHQTGTAFTAPTLFVGVSTTLPTASGTNVTEPSTGSYARATTAGSWGAYSGGAIANNVTISLPSSTAAWASGADIPYVCLFDASSSGNLLYFEPITSGSRIYFDETQINTTTDVITTSSSHGLVDGDRVYFGVPTGSTAPTASGFTTGIGAFYYVNQTSTTTFELHTNSGLSAIVNFTNAGLGSFFVQKVTPRVVGSSGVTLQFTSGNLVLREDDV